MQPQAQIHDADLICAIHNGIVLILSHRWMNLLP